MCKFQFVQVPVDQPVGTIWLTKPVNGVLKRRHSLSYIYLMSFLSATEQQMVWLWCLRSGETERIWYLSLIFAFIIQF